MNVNKTIGVSNPQAITGLTVGATTIVEVASVPSYFLVGGLATVTGATGADAADINGIPLVIVSLTATDIELALNSTSKTILATGTIEFDPTVLSIAVESFEEAGFSIDNQSGVALTNFEVRAIMKSGGIPVTLASAAGDYSTPLWPLRRASALDTLGGANTGVLFLNVAGIQTLIFFAQTTSNNCAITINGQVT